MGGEVKVYINALESNQSSWPKNFFVRMHVVLVCTLVGGKLVYGTFSLTFRCFQV